MLEHAFYKGAVIPGAEVFFQEDPHGSGTEMASSKHDVSFTAMEKGVIERGSVAALFLPYRPRAINYVAPHGKDVISSKFTGCYMVKYKLAGATRVAHVATPDCNDLWDEIKSRKGFKLLAEFKPTDYTTKGDAGEAALSKAISIGGNAGPETLGIITSTHKCYAVSAVRQNTKGVTSIHVVSVVAAK